MLFSSLLFLFVFLPVVLLLYYCCPKRFRCGFLLAANLVFYACGEPVFVLLMLFSILLNWGGGLLAARCREKGRGAVLFGVVLLNLLLLGFFKYAGMIGDTLRMLPPLAGLPALEIPLPIGISFYTFQSMSYVIDVSRGDCEAQRNPVVFGTYVSLFPQLIAGPIVRYRDVEAELADPGRESFALFGDGAALFFVGLAKKVLLANPLGKLWTLCAADPQAAGAPGAWIGAAAFAMQIYFDFSGYSDMARGLGLLFGFHFCENFNYPYTASSVSDFWRRWHMSLTSWFRDYVYIPLGGNRRGTARTLFNLTVVWFLTGLWHGASWNFAAWGLYYAVILIAERLFLGKLLKKLPGFAAHLWVLFCVLIGWVLFAVEDVNGITEYLSVMFAGGGLSRETAVPLLGGIPLMLAGVLACLPAGRKLWERLPGRAAQILSLCFCVLSALLCTASLIRDSYNPFLYFRF